MYPNTFPQNQPLINHQRHPMMPTPHNHQPGMPYHGYPQNQGVQNNAPFYRGDVGVNPNMNMHPPKEFLVKMEDSMYSMPERGPQMLVHENHDTFSSGSTASTNELSIARAGSFNMNPNALNKGISPDFDRFERERGLHQTFPKLLVNRDPVSHPEPVGSFSPEESDRFEFTNQTEAGRAVPEKLSSPKATNKFKKKLSNPIEKPTRSAPLNDSFYSGKGLSSKYIDPLREESGRNAPKMEEELEEGKLPISGPIFKESFEMSLNNSNSLMNTYVSKSKITENEEDTIQFLYDSKSYYIDAVTFTFS